jgi:hypothetical protein
MRILKILLIPAALAFAPAAAMAAPAPPGGAAPAEVRIGIEPTLAHYRTYYHTHRYVPPRTYTPRRYRQSRTAPYRYNYRRTAPYRYNYRPRCYWSSYYQRRICR